jgi:hydrogenase expression/formation protein HypE
MAVRAGLEFESRIESDSAPVHEAVLELLAAGVEIHCLRDLTRGGLTSALNEIAGLVKLTVQVDEPAIPVREDVHAACEILGLDPLSVACEGRFAAFVPAADAPRALALLRARAATAAAIGRVTTEPSTDVYIKSVLGARRILDMPGGEQLPRIC